MSEPPITPAIEVAIRQAVRHELAQLGLINLLGEWVIETTSDGARACWKPGPLAQLAPASHAHSPDTAPVPSVQTSVDPS